MEASMRVEDLRLFSPEIENQTDKRMDNEMETGIVNGFMKIRVPED